MRKLLMGVVCLGAATACSADWYFEAGPLFRGSMGLSVDGGSRAARDGIQLAEPGMRGRMAYAASDAASGESRQGFQQFDNGYVGLSPWPWERAENVTGYFGYYTPGQYDADANTLWFTRHTVSFDTQQRTVTTLESGPAGWSGSEDLQGAGAQVTLGYALGVIPQFQWGVQGQMGWLDGLEASFSGREAWRQQAQWATYESTMERAQTWTYTYDTLGADLPTGPYTSPPYYSQAPTIADRPSSVVPTQESVVQSDVLIGRGGETAVSRVDFDADLRAFSWGVGPRFRWTPGKVFAVVAQAAATMNLLDAELSREEVFTRDDGQVLGRWRDHRSEQKWLPGAGVAAGVQWSATDRFYVQVDSGWDWVQSADLSVGPDNVSVDLSGVRAAMAVGWRL